jgi:hypothetical protein
MKNTDITKMNKVKFFSKLLNTFLFFNCLICFLSCQDDAKKDYEIITTPKSEINIEENYNYISYRFTGEHSESDWVEQPYIYDSCWLTEAIDESNGSIAIVQFLSIERDSRNRCEGGSYRTHTYTHSVRKIIDLYGSPLNEELKIVDVDGIAIHNVGPGDYGLVILRGNMDEWIAISHLEVNFHEDGENLYEDRDENIILPDRVDLLVESIKEGIEKCEKDILDETSFSYYVRGDLNECKMNDDAGNEPVGGDDACLQDDAPECCLDDTIACEWDDE